MATTTSGESRVVNPRLEMSPAEEEETMQAYCAVFTGTPAARREARDTRYAGGAHLLALRPAARALINRCPKAPLVALYQHYLATVIAKYPADRRQSFRDVVLAEQAANFSLDCAQMLAGDRPTRAQLQAMMRGGREQAAASIALVEWCERELRTVVA